MPFKEMKDKDIKVINLVINIFHGLIMNDFRVLSKSSSTSISMKQSELNDHSSDYKAVKVHDHSSDIKADDNGLIEFDDNRSKQVDVDQVEDDQPLKGGFDESSEVKVDQSSDLTVDQMSEIK